MSKSLTGTGVALVTPFTKELEIDFNALKKVIDHVIDGGVDYLVVMGTTGENPTLSWEEQLGILEFVSEEFPSTPIVFGLGGNNTQLLVKRCQDLEDFNLEAILSVNPYYNRPTQRGILEHYKKLTEHFPFPIVLYDVPARTAMEMHIETIVSLASNDRIIGLKDSVGNMDRISKLKSSVPEDFLLISGDDGNTMEIIKRGGSGLISVLGNLMPEEVSRMVRACLQGDQDIAEELNSLLKPFYSLISEEGNPTSIKGGMSQKYLCQPYVRLPLVASSDELNSKFNKALKA